MDQTIEVSGPEHAYLVQKPFWYFVPKEFFLQSGSVWMREAVSDVVVG